MSGQLHRVLAILAGLRLPPHIQAVEVSQDYGDAPRRVPSCVSIVVTQQVPGLSTRRQRRHVWTHLELEQIPDDLLRYQIDTILENFMAGRDPDTIIDTYTLDTPRGRMTVTEAVRR